MRSNPFVEAPRSLARAREVRDNVAFDKVYDEVYDKVDDEAPPCALSPDGFA